ncbi:uncharacterized protein [Diadema setosum]|uniref:uncharacterized protein n=1 Tax=Diadema setosum TaxID=31175 RepID=UPI003B3BA3E0
MSPQSAIIARLTPLRDKERHIAQTTARRPSRFSPSLLVAKTAGRFLFIRLILAFVFPLLAQTSNAVATATTLAPPAANESTDLSVSNDNEGVPKVASSLFIILGVFFLSVGVSWFVRYYFLNPDAPHRCKAGSSVAVSPEKDGLKEERKTDNAHNIKSGLYANIFARSYDSDEEELRELELEAQMLALAEEEGIAIKQGTRPSRAAVLKALETATKYPKLKVNTKRTSKNRWKNVITDLIMDRRNDKDVTVDLESSRGSEHCNNIHSELVAPERSSEKMNGNVDSNQNLTTVVIHRSASPLPPPSIQIVSNYAADDHTSQTGDGPISDTPRTIPSSRESRTSERFSASEDIDVHHLTGRRGQRDIDGYSTDFESISLHSELSVTTDLHESSDKRHVKGRRDTVVMETEVGEHSHARSVQDSIRTKSEGKETNQSPAENTKMSPTADDVISSTEHCQHAPSSTSRTKSNETEKISPKCVDVNGTKEITVSPAPSSTKHAQSIQHNEEIDTQNEPETETQNWATSVSRTTSKLPGSAKTAKEPVTRNDAEQTPSPQPIKHAFESTIPPERPDVSRGNDTRVDVYAKYASNSNLPNKHIKKEPNTTEEDEPPPDTSPGKPQTGSSKPTSKLRSLSAAPTRPSGGKQTAGKPNRTSAQNGVRRPRTSKDVAPSRDSVKRKNSAWSRPKTSTTR